MTAEAHPNFPAIVSQSSLKVTYEVHNNFNQGQSSRDLWRRSYSNGHQKESAENVQYVGERGVLEWRDTKITNPVGTGLDACHLPGKTQLHPPGLDKVLRIQ